MAKLLVAFLFLVLPGFAAAAEAAPAAEDPALEKRVNALAAELRCLVCQNQTIADSNAGLAVDLKNQIRERMKAGESDAQIVDFMVERYGDFILYRPPLKATTVLLWTGPPALLAIGLIVLYRRLRRLSAAAALVREDDEDEQGEAGGAHGATPAAVIPAQDPHPRELQSGTGIQAPRPKLSRAMVFALWTFIPLGAAAVYLVVGTPAALDPQALASSNPEHHVDRQQLETMVDAFASKLAQDPENAEGWVMLARSYKYLERFPEAARAYGNAVSRVPPNATLLADYADVLAMAQGRKLDGEPARLIAKALEIDPKHLKALALAGSAEFERKNYAGAAQYWERMLPLAEPGSEQARAISANVEEARSLAGIATAKPAKASGTADAGIRRTDASAAVPALAGARVTGTVSLSPALAARVAPTDAVLIYARPAEGSRMPLAVLRKQARDLPAQFTLDDSMAMQPGMTLSKSERIVIAARVSRSAAAAAQRGDFEGASAPVANTAQGLSIVIDSEVR